MDFTTTPPCGLARRPAPLGLLLLAPLILSLAVGCASEEPTTNPPTANITSGDADSPAYAAPPAANTSTPDNAEGSPAVAQTDADPMRPMVLISTSLGDIKVQLDREKAPVTVNNFLSYADTGHYDGCIFHQVIEQFIVLGGGYDAQLVEKPSSIPIRNEAANGLTNERGTIAMARQADVIASSTSQFFFNVTDNPALDHQSEVPAEFGYCVFGKVIEGMDVVDKISQVQVTDRDNFESIPAANIVIHSVTRAR
ncbi:MAG: peptidylprolyl isomerase [Pirellulales bacterium]